MNFHEELNRGHEARGSSDRAYGLVMAAACALVGLWPLRWGGTVRMPTLVLGGVFLVIAAVRPSLLRPLNRAWTVLGVLMGMVVNPVVSAALFYLVFTPVGILMRATGKDPLRLRWEKEAGSYWLVRTPPGPAAGSMSKQF